MRLAFLVLSGKPPASDKWFSGMDHLLSVLFSDKGARSVGQVQVRGEEVERQRLTDRYAISLVSESMGDQNFFRFSSTCCLAAHFPGET